MLSSGEEHGLFQTLRKRDEPDSRWGCSILMEDSRGSATVEPLFVPSAEAIGLDTPCVTFLDGGGLAVKTDCRIVCGRLLKGSSSQIAQPIKPELHRAIQ